MRRKLDKAIAAGQKLTYAGAESEVVADASEYILQDSQFVKNLDAGLKNKVKRIMQDFMAKIRAAFKALVGGHEESVALRTMQDGVRKYSDRLQRLWDAGFMEMATAKVRETQSEESTGTVQYSPRNVETENKTSIKDQLRAIQAQLNTMDVVASVHAPSFDNAKEKDRKAWAINELKSSGYKTDVKDFGIVEHGEKEINNSLNYLNSSEEIAAFACIPRVLKRGIRTSGHENHKGRNYTTVTFAAPVEINGVRGNMAVVVKQTSKNHYKTHRVLMPDGSAFVYNDNKKTEPTPAGGIPSEGKAQATHISSATDIVPQTSETVNENIQKSVRDQTETDAFKRWFAGSKVVDESGNPMIVYHGTDADFNAFDMSKGRANMDIQGAFFSPYIEDAQGYGGDVKSVYLSIKNPANESTAYRALNKFKGQNGAGKKARDLLISMGYDGVYNGYDEYIAFYPEQIKSATENVGTFDPENQDIRYSRRDADIDEVSIREYLGAMQPTTRMTETEKLLLKRYQENLRTLEEKEKLVAKQEEIIRTAHKAAIQLPICQTTNQQQTPACTHVTGRGYCLSMDVGSAFFLFIAP